MKKENKKYFFILLSVIAIIILINYTGIGRELIIGEEGYEEYDPQLQADSYNPNLWTGVNGENVNNLLEVSNNQLSIYGNSALIGGEVNWRTGNVMRPFSFEGQVEGIDCYGVFTASEAFCNDAPVCVNNLYLIDFLTEFSSGTSNIILDGTSFIGGLNDNIKLLWDDYELGHYNFFINNKLVKDGTVDDEELKLCFLPKETIYYKNIENHPSWQLSKDIYHVKIYNPRFKRLFGCDEAGGEFIASMTFKGPNEITIADLVGFERFCTDHESIFLNAGVSTGSKRVYYDLAKGEPLIIQENQAWRIFYIADGERLGITDDCEEAYEIGTGCSELTGFVSVDEEDPTIIVDVIDFDNSIRLLDDGTIYWGANKYNEQITSGDETLLRISTPEYLCEGNDFHSENPTLERYTSQDMNCFNTEINGVTISPTGSTKIDDYWTATPTNFHAKVRYDVSWNEGQATIKDSEWGMGITLKHTKNYYDIISVSEEDPYHKIHLESAKKTDSVILIHNDPKIIDQRTTTTINKNLLNGENIISYVPTTDYLEENYITIAALLKTNAGNLLSSNELEYAYNVMGDADGDKEVIVETVTETIVINNTVTEIRYIDTGNNQQFDVNQFWNDYKTIIFIIGGIILLLILRPK